MRKMLRVVDEYIYFPLNNIFNIKKLLGFHKMISFEIKNLCVFSAGTTERNIFRLKS